MADIIESKEHWDWLKFLKGFFDGKNYAKALVFGVCLTVMVVIGYSTYTVIKSRFVKVQPTQAVGTNSGTINTENTDKQGNTWSLFNLFNWR